MCCIILGSCRCPTKLTSESFDFITLNTHVKLTVWHVLDAVSKRQIDTVMTDYSVYNFTTDAVYTRAVWAKFELY